jgi:Ca2+-binding RTX toxin-like protein
MSTRAESLRRWSIAIAGLAIAGSVACGDDKAKDASADGGDKPGAGTTNAPAAKKKPSANSTDSGLGDAGVLSTDPLFEGVPTDEIPFGVPPAGCVRGFDAQSGLLSIELGGEVIAVHLAIVDDALLANGVRCSADDGATMTADEIRAIEVTGDDGDNLVILDLSSGAFGAALLAGDASIALDLGEGDDRFVLVGTQQEDDIHLGTLDGELRVRFGAKGTQLRALNVESLIASLGPGTDTFDATGGDALGTALSIPSEVFTGDDNDVLQGGAGDDLLHGGAGDEQFYAADSADGSDVYDGGEGQDQISYALRHGPLTITLDDIRNDGEEAEGDDVQSTIEDVIGGLGADSMTGSALANVIVGGPGDDQLSGGDGDDTFIEAERSEGTDVMNGGPGSDTIDYSGRTANLTVTLCAPVPETCASGACGCKNDNGEPSERDTLVSVDNALGGSGDDVLVGDDASNSFRAGAGDDQVSGGLGDDTLYGDDGEDTLSGGPGEDLLDGSEGNDTFDGGEGQGDICTVQPSEKPVACELF